MRRAGNEPSRYHLIDQARQCVEWLKINGYEVLVVIRGTYQPRIVIKSSMLCAELHGAVQAFERTQHGERRYNYVSRFDCTVEWEAA